MNGPLNSVSVNIIRYLAMWDVRVGVTRVTTKVGDAGRGGARGKWKALCNMHNSYVKQVASHALQLTCEANSECCAEWCVTHLFAKYS